MKLTLQVVEFSEIRKFRLLDEKLLKLSGESNNIKNIKKIQKQGQLKGRENFREFKFFVNC